MSPSIEARRNIWTARSIWGKIMRKRTPRKIGILNRKRSFPKAKPAARHTEM